MLKLARSISTVWTRVSVEFELLGDIACRGLPAAAADVESEGLVKYGLSASE
jgi:hypothetical protein